MPRRSDRGAIIIQVAIALLGLTMFSAFVVDFGILWSAKGQAQNAADAGALAAALNLMAKPTNTTEATTAAKKLANANAVWLQNTADADILVQTGLTCPPGSGGGPGCVRVDVLRGATDRNNAAHTNTLPTIFARLAGISSQAINATATAQVASGNAVRCLKPWGVPDKWIDGDEAPIGGWSQTDVFNPPTDTYSMPGFQNPQDNGVEIVLKSGNTSAWSAGWMQEVDWGQPGSPPYEQAIAGCPSWVPSVSIYQPGYKCDAKGDTPDPSKGCVSVKTGTSQGPTDKGITDLIKLDKFAYWNGTAVAGGCQDSGAGACAAVNPAGYDFSPRIVPVALFNPKAYFDEACNGGTGCVIQISNIIGFFVEGFCSDIYSAANEPAYCGTKKSEWDKNIIGRIIKYPGSLDNNGGPNTSSFAQAVRLVR